MATVLIHETEFKPTKERKRRRVKVLVKCSCGAKADLYLNPCRDEACPDPHHLGSLWANREARTCPGVQAVLGMVEPDREHAAELLNGAA